MDGQSVEELVSEKDAESCEKRETEIFNLMTTSLLPHTVERLQTGTFLVPAVLFVGKMRDQNMKDTLWIYVGVFL